jgi:hypothetical protein
MFRNTRLLDDKLFEILRNRHHPGYATYISIGHATLYLFGKVTLPMHRRHNGNSHHFPHQTSVRICGKLMSVNHLNPLAPDK